MLGAREPAFRAGLRQLERASGNPSEDIRLSSEVRLKVQQALRELGLDSHDTTGQELYNALLERTRHDDAAIKDLLGTDTDETNLMLRTQRLLKKLDYPRSIFALKTAAAKRLLKKNPPKKAMKSLGYRSADSLLKHEPVAQIQAAALICEASSWHRAQLAQYKLLKPMDFEVRDISFLVPNSKHWEALGADFVGKNHQNILTFKELGSVILLPLAADAVPGAALMTLILVINAINDIRTTSAYLKLHQVRPDFGELVAGATRGEPYTKASLVGDERLPWKLVQKYFARSVSAFVPELFEPHVQREDLMSVSVESVLSKLHPRFEFWKGRSHTGLLHDQQLVSLNIADAALNFCNHLPYEQRVVHYLRDHLWRELMLRYMHQDNLERTIHEQLEQELVRPQLSQ